MAKQAGKSFEDGLNEKQKEQLADLLGEATVQSGAAALDPTAVDLAGGEVIVGGFVEAAQGAPELAAMEAAAAAAASTGATARAGKVLSAQAKQLREILASAPESAPARIRGKGGIEVYVPSSVIDGPNGFIVRNPEAAKKAFVFLTQPHTNKVVDLCAKHNPFKPLLHLSQEIHRLVVRDRWTPPRGFCSDQFDLEAHAPGTDMFRVLEMALGADNAQALLYAADKVDCPVIKLLHAVYDELIRQHDEYLTKVTSIGTVHDWRVPEDANPVEAHHVET